MAAPTEVALRHDHFWMWHYLADWGVTERKVDGWRAYTTALRWWHAPEVRWRALTLMQANATRSAWLVPPQAELNLRDLMDSSVWVGAHHSARAFWRFVQLLAVGDFVTGSRYVVRGDEWMVAVRPGYAFLRWAWRASRSERPLPWPFWIFPRAPSWPVPS